ncbi:MAG: hypothetical protein PHS02_04660 [Candidatus ainarchaeum sp.]|nr:hypothetical protein [Candidatus ainarchaeum sp.]
MDLNTAWKKTCTVLLGSDIGGLEQYKDYLGRYVEHSHLRKSGEGKEIAVDGRICAQARVADYSDLADGKQDTQLNINEIKDIDSLIGAAKEHFVYSGNMWLGNCQGISKSNKCVDSFFVEESERVFYSKYVYRSSIVRNCEFVFGSVHAAEINFGMKNYETWRSVRTFEVFRLYTSSDCYFCANMDSCQNCLFCFNIKNSANCIGNLQLEQGRFLELKKKLVSEMRQELKDKKRLPSVFDIMGGSHGGN